MTDAIAIADRLRLALNPTPRAGDFDLDRYADDLAAGVPILVAGFLPEASAAAPELPADAFRPALVGWRIAPEDLVGNRQASCAELNRLNRIAGRYLHPASTAASLPFGERRLLVCAWGASRNKGLELWALAGIVERPEIDVLKDVRSLSRRRLVTLTPAAEDGDIRVVPTDMGRSVAAAATRTRINPPVAP